MAKRKARQSPRPVPPDLGGPPPVTSASAAVALETFLVACQKSLARSVRSAQQGGKADNQFGLGERPMYMIDGIDMEISVGVQVSSPRQTAGGEHVLLDFEAPADTRSKIRFRVQNKPVELVRGAKLELANLDPLGVSAPVARMRAWLVDEDGRPVPNAAIEIHFARAGEATAKSGISVVTDAAGRVDFFVEPMTNEVKIVGKRQRRKVFLQGSGRGINEDEYFVWATATRRPEWKVVAKFSSPFPPQSIPSDGELPLMLVSEMHRLQIDRRR